MEYRQGSQKKQVKYKSLQHLIKYHVDITEHKYSRRLEMKAVDMVQGDKIKELDLK